MLIVPGGIGQAFAPIRTVGANAVLLQHYDGNLIDALGRHSSITATGDAAINTTQKKFGSGSLYCDAVVSSYVTIADNLSDFTLAGDFTIDFWMYATSFDIGMTSWGISTTSAFTLYTSTSQIYVYFRTNSFYIYDPTALSVNTWYHIALTRQGTTITLYKNGVNVASGTSATLGTLTADSTGIIIGCDSTNKQLTGYIDEYRVVNGTAMWTANFTPPSAPYQ